MMDKTEMICLRPRRNSGAARDPDRRKILIAATGIAGRNRPGRSVPSLLR